MSYTNEVSIVNDGDIERRVLRAMLLAFGFLSILYVFFLGNMIFNIVERKNVESQVRTLANEVMDLEAKYLSMSEKVNLSESYALGFKDTKINFATRESLGSLGYGKANTKGENEI